MRIHAAFRFLVTAAVVVVFHTASAQAACTSPAGAAGDQIYNSSFNVMQFCDGTSWTAMKGGMANGDNLGNHTATTTLNMAASAITSSAGTIRDANGGWVRTYGNTGWYNGTYAGGWTMTDSNYLRNQSGEGVYVTTDGSFASMSGINTGANYGLYGQSAGTYGIYGRTTSAGHGGVIGYSGDASVYGILAHANAWSFYGNSNTYTAGYVRGDQGFRVGGTVSVTSGGVVVGGVPSCSGADKALQFNGSAWSCGTISGTGSGSSGANCSGNSVSWGGCIGNAGTGAHGAVAVVNDSFCCSPGYCSACSGNTGSATATCNNGVWTLSSSTSCGGCNASDYSGCGDDDFDEAADDLIKAKGAAQLLDMVKEYRDMNQIK